MCFNTLSVDTKPIIKYKLKTFVSNNELIWLTGSEKQLKMEKSPVEQIIL